MNSVVLDDRWPVAMQRLGDAHIPVLVAAGNRDDVADTGLHRRLAQRYPNLHARTAPGAGHLLPVTHAAWCVAQVSEQDAQGRS